MADTTGLEPVESNLVGVQVPLVAPSKNYANVAEWHTHRSKKPAPHGLRVQVPSLVPMSKYQITKQSLPLEVYKFNTTQELKEIEFVSDAMSASNFLCLSRFQLALMCEKIDGPVEVIGLMVHLEGLPTDMSGLDIPEWKPPPP